MAMGDVLDDGETQACAALLARAMAINPVESFRQTGNVKGIKAVAMVGDVQSDQRAPRPLLLPLTLWHIGCNAFIARRKDQYESQFQT